MKSVASEASLTLYLLSSRSVQFLLSAELLLIQDRGDSLQLQIFTLFRHIHMMRFFAEWLLFVDEAIFRWLVQKIVTILAVQLNLLHTLIVTLPASIWRFLE